MSQLKIFNQTKNTLISSKCRRADTMFTRMQGLLGKDSLNEGEGLLITRCRSIHMFFMKFSIDVIFVRKDNIVVGCVKKIPPFRLSPVFWKASFAIELPAGTIDASQTEIGDNLLIQ